MESGVVLSPPAIPTLSKAILVIAVLAVIHPCDICLRWATFAFIVP